MRENGIAMNPTNLLGRRRLALLLIHAVDDIPAPAARRQQVVSRNAHPSAQNQAANARQTCAAIGIPVVLLDNQTIELTIWQQFSCLRRKDFLKDRKASHLWTTGPTNDVNNRTTTQSNA